MPQNEMRGRIASDSGQDWYPLAKRVKTLESRSCSSHRQSDESSPGTPDAREIPDSEAEEEDIVAEIVERHTDLESVLPPIETDKDAVAEYEASRSAKNDDALALTDRLEQRKWVKGKSSIYVDAFNLALETVLQDESHLFNDAEMDVFSQWKALDYDAQYL
jgi:Fanconi-associated nuclease 1